MLPVITPNSASLEGISGIESRPELVVAGCSVGDIAVRILSMAETWPFMSPK